MSEGDVSLIRDEDLLRRMWQQTEDFSRKKEIRAHMYRLREERLRNLYSPEPTRDGKGTEFSAAQGHVKSFADQSFQSMKSKEVRDAGSPPKEFTYRGQDLKALSNAGWNVESENKTTDDGHTHVKSVHANIEGRYDVDGGKGQFAAVDHHKEAITEYHDDNSSLKRNETSSNTAAREHVVRKTDDGTQISSTTSSSNSSSKFQQMSSTKHESVPYLTNDDYDLPSYDTNRNEDASSLTRRKITKTNDYEQNLRNNDYEKKLRMDDYQQNVRKEDYQTVRQNEYERSVRKKDYEQNVTRSDYETGELVSRKIDYPDDNTRVIVETRCLPDGTRVTSTKREFRAPVQSTRSEQSYQTRENKSYSTQLRSDARESSKIIRHVVDDRATDIVDSQRHVDDSDFKRQIAQYTTKDNDDYLDVQRHDRTVNKKVVDHSKVDDDYSQTTRHVTRVNKVIESAAKDDHVQTHQTHHRKYDTTNFRRETVTPLDTGTTRDCRPETVMPRGSRPETVETRDSRPETFTPRNERPEAKTPSYDRPEKTTPRDSRPETFTPRNERPDYYRPRSERPETCTPRNERPDTFTPRSERPETRTPQSERPDTRTPQSERPDTRAPQSERPDTRTPQSERPDTRTPQSERPDTRTPRNERPDSFTPRNERPDTDTARDHHPDQPKDNIPQQTRHTEERVHQVTRDKKVDETVERKTDHYQTTYQTDFPQKKISSDWSPSHQAWASTLRADTPTTTRPSTRASSPGSRTFKSSTSSLRSSVSPDKTTRKPSSRGGSPNKIDRYSPTRTVSDRHSTTSTHSVTEVKTHKYTSPDDKRPPTGRSPTRPGHSPERKPQDHRQRPSASPEKRPQDLIFRPSASPDRKPTQKGSPTTNYPRTTSPTRPVNRGESPTRPRASPERKPTQHSSPISGSPRTTPDRTNYSFPKDISKKPSQSPERKPGYQKPNDSRPSPTSEYPRTTSPTRPYHPTDSTKRPGTSPERKPGYQPTSPVTDRPDKLTDKHFPDDTPKRGSVSPDRKPGYMRPTSANKPSDSRKSPTKPSDQKSPTKHAPSQSPERKPQDHTKTTTKIQADHYKFIDEETKMYTRTDKTDTNYPKSSPSGPDHASPKDKVSSPTRKSPGKDTPDLPRKRSPSPKEHVTFIDQRDQVDTTQVKKTDFTEEKTTMQRSPKDKDSPIGKTAPKEPSPSKYGTYDKKKPYDHDVTEVTTTTTKDTKDVKFDSLTRPEKSPKKTPDQPSSPTKKAPRDSVSPVKFHSKDITFKHTTDFISTERTNEEVIKKTTKAHPRKLVTPSSSPTRKPKPTDTEPSTGQSSPTTSVSGFVYFSSPRAEKTVVTDLDDQEYYSETHSVDENITTHKRPESLDVKRPQSPSKIPCRSPSPEKRVSPAKDSLPRKSSLKKPTTEISQASPIEKPPSSFRVSPTEEPKDLPHKVVKKDHPEGPSSDGPVGKQKPPLERRETYEDRCRKILGMMDDTATTETVKKTTYLKEPETNLSSPSVSPCRSPAPRETPFEYPIAKKTTDTKTDVSDFITHEQENIVKTTTTRREDAPTDKKPKTPRESSPTKLQDIITKDKTVLKHDKTTKDTEEIKKPVMTEYPSTRESPQRKPYQPSEDVPNRMKKDDTPKARGSPERTPKDSEYPETTIPSNRRPSDTSPRSSLSPERIPGCEPAEKKPGNQYPEELTPVTPGYMKSTSAVSSKYDTTTEDITVTTNTRERKPSRSSESPTRKTPSDKPSKPGQPSNKSPQRKPSCDQKAATKTSPEKKPTDELPREASPFRPGFNKTTTSMVVEYDSSSTTEDLEDSTTTKTRPSSRPSGSPTRPPKPSDDVPAKYTYSSNKNSERKPLKPKDSSPTRPNYMKTTASMTSKFEATSTEDLQETITSETVQTRRSSPRTSDSPTRKTSKPSDDSRPRPFQPKDQSPDRKPHTRDQPSPTKFSPEKKSTAKYPRDISPTYAKPDKIPNYMKTTSAISTKYDTVSTTEDVEETTSLEITEKRHPQRSSDSPTRKTSQPEDYQRKISPSGFPQQTDKSPQRKPKDETTPKRASPEKQPADKYPKEPSPTRQTPSSEKTPGFMKTTSSHIYKQDTVSATKDFLETCRTEIVERKHSPRPSVSPSRKPSKPGDKHEPESDSPRSVPPSRSHPENITSRKSVSPDSKPGHQQPTEPQGRKPTDKHPREISPSKQTTSPETPGYMRTTTSVSSREDTTEIYEDDISKTKQNRYPSSRPSELPTQKTPKSDGVPDKPHLDRSPNRLPRYDETSPRASPERQTRDRYPKETSPSRKMPTSDEKEPTHLKSTTTVRSTYDSTLEDIQKTTKSKVTEDHNYTSRPSDTMPSRRAPKSADGPKSAPEHPRTQSPTKHQPEDSMKKTFEPKEIHTKKPGQKYPQQSSPTRSSSSPDRKPSHMKPTASVTSKFESTSTTEKFENTEDVVEKHPSPRSSVSPSRRVPHEPSQTNSGYLQQPEEPRQPRTPSPMKKTTKVTEVSTDFLMSEREQEILDRVQKSLRKLSPERKEKSPSRERSPGKTTTSLQDIDITHHTEIDDESLIEDVTEITDKFSTPNITSRPEKPKDEKPKDHKVPSKLSTRTVSPTKKPSGIATPTKLDKIADSPTKTRSISPKKLVSPFERPQSPQVSKPSGIKPKEQIPSHLTRKPTPATLNVTKVEKTATDSKKTTNISSATKQNSFTRTTTSRTPTKTIPSPTTRSNELESKRTLTPKGTRESVIPTKKDSDTKVTRTVSDIIIKSKKTSPQRMKSKPEITVSDVSTKTTNKTSSYKEPHSKLPTKPKSATTLNTSTDEDDVIIDVQQSKSSRENSPDRICPTPVNFGEDVGTPRYPDEVSEPDDEFNRRTHHTIHEAETIVDDIVEICEDDELFVRKTDIDTVNDDDESLLSVTDKVSRFTKGVDTVTKPKDTTTTFKDTERRVHSDYIDERLKSDECLLSVSEKVNKFAKGPRDTRDSKSPSRRVTDEYDKNTVYQDDYTKLSVHDKAHLFVETAENVKTPKVKQTPQRVERPDLTNVDDSLKSDDCLLSVSDKVHKFVKTAEQFLTESHEVEEKEKKIKEQHDKIMQKIVDDADDEEYEIETTTYTEDVVVTDNRKTPDRGQRDDKPLKPKETTSSLPKVKDYSSPNKKPTERPPTVKITTLRSSEAVKKAKALFENIATTTQKTKETTHDKTAKLTDIGVMKKSPKTDSTTVLHPSVGDGSPNITDVDSEVDAAPHTPKDRPTSGTLAQSHYPRDDKPRSSPSRLAAQSPELPRSISPMRQTMETTTTTKTLLSRYPASPRGESPRQRPENEKPDKVPGYLRPTKTSQIKEETKVVEETEVSSRRGSGKFGIELRRTSVERSTASSERRRSVEHPCIEDIFDLDLLEQMLEKVVGYEQRRRIRSQIRIAKKKVESDHVDHTNTYTKTTRQTTTTQKLRSPERLQTRSPERAPKSSLFKTTSPDRHAKTPQRSVPERTHPREQVQPVLNGHAKEPSKTVSDRRPHSSEKSAPKSASKTKSPVRHPSPDKKTRTQSPNKTATPKPKPNRFNEYASAYMKKVGLSEADKIKFAEAKSKKAAEEKQRTVKHTEEHKIVEEYSTAKRFTERTSSRDVIEVVHMNGTNRRSPSPEKQQSPERRAQSSERKAQYQERVAQSPERKVQRPERKVQSPERKAQYPDRKAQSPERKVQYPDRKAQSPDRKAHSPERIYDDRTPSPVHKQLRTEPGKKETIIKTMYEIEKKIPQKSAQEEKPSWVTNRNLKKISSETRAFSSKKIEEKPKYRAASPSKVITKPIDVITSSYGPGPVDSDGKPLFGIRALRNGASNYQVKGTVIRSEYHSRNGGEPEGSVSVTAYSTEPEDLERLLQGQGEPPSRIHGLAAITTTKKFGGDTGTTLKEAHGREDRAAIDQFTHSDRRVSDTKIEDTSERHFDSRREEIVGETRRYETRREEIGGETRRIENRREEIIGDRSRQAREELVDSAKDRREDKTERMQRRVEKKEDRTQERKERTERPDDKKTVRQSSVKSLTEKYIKSANESSRAERNTYPKAGLILRTATMKDSVSSDSSAHAGLTRTDSEHSLGSVEDTVVTTERVDGGVRTVTTTTSRHGTTTHQGARGEKSFLDSSTKVTGVQDILTRMKNADIVIQEGDTTEDAEARALLNKFLGATVLMAGMQSYVTEKPTGKLVVKQETVRTSSSSGGGKVTSSQTRTLEDFDVDQCWDERLLRKLLDECNDYEQRRRLRARIRTLMAEQEACASAVTEALAAAGETDGADADSREEEEVTVTSSVRRNSSEKTVSSSTTTTKTSKVIESMTRPAPKPVSPFAKFRQLEKQNSTNSPKM